MIPSMIFALCLFVAGGLWLLVEMFRASVWWGIFGLLLPPVQMFFVLVHWGRAWRPLLLQLLGLVVLLVGLWRDPDLRFQEYWYQTIQQTSAAMPGSLESVADNMDESPVVPDPEPVEEPAARQTIYKCKDARGKIAYYDKPCPDTSQMVESMPVNEEAASSSAAGDSLLADWLPEAPSAVVPAPASSFRCDGRTHCSQMTSCAEAKFFLANCPDVKMDGGSDGVPCESQWCGR